MNFKDGFVSKFRGREDDNGGFKGKYPGKLTEKNGVKYLVNDSSRQVKPLLPSREDFEKTYNSCLHLLDGVREKKGHKLGECGILDLKAASLDTRYGGNAKELLDALNTGEKEVRDALSNRFTNSHRLNFLLLSYYRPEELLFYDIETKSLASETSIITIGLGWYEGPVFRVKQFTVLEDAAEYEIIQEFLAIASGKKAFVTYNGRSFDIPFTDMRASYHSITCGPEITQLPNFDLLHFCRRAYSDKLDSYSLKDMERSILGINRKDDISGEDVFIYYGRYLSSGDPKYLKPIISHNAEDIFSLALLVNKLAAQWKK